MIKEKGKTKNREFHLFDLIDSYIKTNNHSISANEENKKFLKWNMEINLTIIL